MTTPPSPSEHPADTAQASETAGAFAPTDGADGTHAAATYAAAEAFFGAAVAAGVRFAVMSPGSRSTPLALCAEHADGLTTIIRVDERSAAFTALGLAQRTGVPTLLVCTSGTAAANYLPAVVEAFHAEVPLVVATADRPPELRGWGAGQTIDQVRLYGSHVRWFADAPVPSSLAPEAAVRHFTRLGARAVTLADGSPAGPVHVNLPFAEPLTPPADWPQARPIADTRDRVATHQLRAAAGGSAAHSALVQQLADFAGEHSRGVVVAGPMRPHELSEEAVADIDAFCAAAGWPLLAEATSQLRRTLNGTVNVAHFDALLRSSWAEHAVPSAVLRIGRAPTSKPLREWLEAHRPQHALVAPTARFDDASFTMTHIIAAPVELLTQAAAHLERRSNDWSQRWQRAAETAAATVEATLAQQTAVGLDQLSQPAVVAALDDALTADSALVVSNSMPVRDVDAFLPQSEQPARVFSNRGASGIDGVLSTAVGVALADGGSTTVLLGDLAFRHNIGCLAAMFDDTPPQHFTVVVLDDGGGGIFRQLPVANAVSPSTFERLFVTPVAGSAKEVASALSGSLGFNHRHVTSLSQLTAALASVRGNSAPETPSTNDAESAKGPTGVTVVTVEIDPNHDATCRQQIQATVNAAVAQLLADD